MACPAVAQAGVGDVIDRPSRTTGGGSSQFLRGRLKLLQEEGQKSR